MVELFCKCGCGNEIVIKPHHKYVGIPEYLHGHNKAHLRKHHSPATVKRLSESHKGITLSDEIKSKIGETLKSNHLKNGFTKKELARGEKISVAKIKHGHAYKGVTPTYISWCSMKARCSNSNDEFHWPFYGGRGITVCDRWLGEHGFENFIEDMGERPEGMTIDRKNNDGNYEPSNCQWADKITQIHNRR